MATRIRFLWRLAALLSLGLLLTGQDNRLKTIFDIAGKPLLVRYDNLQASGDVFRAIGHVEMSWEDYKIYADTVEFNRRTNQLLAEGRVTLADRQAILSGERLRFNIKTEAGELDDTYGLMSPFLNYQTDKIVQRDSQTLTFNRLSLTGCAQVRPRWKITCRKGKIKKEKYVEMNDALFTIKGIPVFYLPYLRYPVAKDGRATGLLMPNFGNSSLRGFFITNSFFWAIRSNLDLTVNADYYSLLGVGLGEEFRYLLPQATGNLRFYFFKYNPDNPVDRTLKSDYFIDAKHEQRFRFLHSRLVLEVNQQSRVNFLRLLDNNFDRLLSNNYLTSLYWTSSFGKANLSLLLAREQTYYTFANDSNVIEKLPSLSFRLNKQKLGKFPGYFSLTADFDNINRKGVSYEGEPTFRTGFDSRRLSLVPSYQIALLQLPWLAVSADLASKNTFYAKSLDVQTQQVVDQPISIHSQSAQFTVRGPVFARVFEVGDTRLKHSVEPSFEFHYASQDPNRDRVVPVDLVDYPGFSYAGFSLTSRLLAKEKGEKGSATEVVSLKISQRYYFDPAQANFYRQVNGVYPKFSELAGDLRIALQSDMYLNAKASYNFYIHALSQFNVGFNFDRRESVWGGSLYSLLPRSLYAG